MPEQPTYYDFLIKKGLNADQATKVNEAHIARQKEPWRYTNATTYDTPDWLSPVPMSAMDDFGRRIANGFAGTIKGVANIIPAAGNFFAPEDSRVHKVFNDWIDGMNDFIQPVVTGEKDAQYNFMEHPTVGNAVRDMGSMFGFILPITLATLAAPETGGASLAPLARTLFGIGEGVSTAQKAAEVTTFFGQSLSAADQELRDAGITGKNRDYLLMALPALQVAAGEAVFRGAAPLYRKAANSFLAQRAIKETVDEVADKYGGNLSDAAFKDYFKPMLKGVMDKTVRKMGDLATGGVPEGLTFATFNTLSGNLNNLVENLYDTNAAPTAEIGKGRFGAPDIFSSDNLKNTAKEALHGMIMGVMLGAGKSFFNPVVNETAYHLIDKSIDKEAQGDPKAWDNLNQVRQLLTDRTVTGKLPEQQHDVIQKNIDDQIAAVRDFKQRFPESALSDPLARKQMFDFSQTNNDITQTLGSLDEVTQAHKEVLDPVLGTPLTGGADHMKAYLEDSKKLTEDMMQKVASSGQPMSNEGVLSHYERLRNQYFGESPAQPQEANPPATSGVQSTGNKVLNDWGVLSEYAKKNGYKGLKNPTQLKNALKKYLNIDADTTEIKPEHIQALVVERDKQKAAAAPPKTVPITGDLPADFGEQKEVKFQKSQETSELDSRIAELQNQAQGLTEAAGAAYGVIQKMVATRGRASEFLKNQTASLIHQIGDINSQIDALRKLRATAEVKPKATKAFLDKVISTLKKGKFGGVEVSASKEEFDAALSEAKTQGKATVISNKDTVYGFIKDGKVHLNPDTVREDTPIHEYGHIWLSWAREKAPELWKQGVDLISKTPKYLAEVKKDYPELEGDALHDEALARLIGENGTDVFKRLGESPDIITKIGEFLRDLWSSIKTGFKKAFGSMTPEEIATMKVKDFAEKAAKDILYGKDTEAPQVGDVAHKIRDPYLMNKNDRRVWDYLDDPRNPLSTQNFADYKDEIHHSNTINVNGLKKSTLIKLAKWAINDGNPSDMKPLSKTVAEEITDTLWTNPEGKVTIMNNGGRDVFADKLWDHIRHDKLNGDPATMSPLQKDLFGAITYMKGMLNTDGLRLGANTNNVNDAMLFSVDQFGNPTNFGSLTRDLPDLDFSKMTMRVQGKINKLSTPEELRNYIDEEIARYRKSNTDAANKPLTTIPDSQLDELKKLSNNDNVLTDLLSGQLTLPESAKLRQAIARLEIYNDTQAINTTRYITSSGTAVDRDAMNTQADGDIAENKTRVEDTLKNNPIAQLFNSTLGQVLNPAVKALKKRGIDVSMSKIALRSQNLKTVGLRMFGAEGKPSYRLFIDPFFEGERQQQGVIKKMRDFMSVPFQAIQRGTRYQNMQPYESLEKDTFTNYEGATTEMTKAQLLGLYLTLRQERYLVNHKDYTDPKTGTKQEGSGVVITKMKDGQEVQQKIHFNDDDFQNLRNKINGDKTYSNLVKAWDDFSKSVYPDINRLHKLTHGTELGNIADYFPVTINRAGDTLGTEYVKMLENMKVLKTRLNSQEPLHIGDAIQTMNRYANDIAKYVGYVVPSQNMEKFIHDHTSAIDKAGGSDPIAHEIDYMKNFVKDLNDSLTKQYIVDDSSFWQKALSAYGVSRLMYNFSPVLKQNISYVMANQLVPSKYLWAHVPDVAKIFFKGGGTALYKWKNAAGAEDTIAMWDKHSPYLYNRAMGSFGNLYAEAQTQSGITEISPPAYGKDGFSNARTLIKRMQSHGMEWVRIADMATIVGIQKAVVDMLRDQHPHLDPKSDEFNGMAVRYAEKVVRETQHGYDATTKTPLQRSNNPIYKAVFMFTGQLMKQYNLLAQSLHNYLYDPSTSNQAKLLNHAVNIGIYNSYWVASVTMLNGVVSGYINPNDDDKLKALTHDAMLELAGNFPQLNVPLSMVYTRLDDAKWKRELTIPALALFNQTADATSQYFKAATLDDKSKSMKQFHNGLKNTGSVVFQGLGLPYKLLDLVEKNLDDTKKQ